MAKITKGDVFEFVKKELVPVNPEMAACADGRYDPEQSKGALRVFGGDFGIVLAFAAALKQEGTFIDADEIVTRYYRAVQQIRGENTKLYYHTDEHNHAEGKIGCGHAAGACDPANDGLYGITYIEAQSLYETFAKNPHSNITVLKGKHEEKGVLIVHGEGKKVTHSVNSQNKKGEMYFVIDAAGIDKFIDQATPIFSNGLLVPVDPEDVKASYIKQQRASEKLLGADQLPFHKVRIKENGNFIMQQLPKQKSLKN